MKLKQRIWKTGTGMVITIPQMVMKLLDFKIGDEIIIEFMKGGNMKNGGKK